MLQEKYKYSPFTQYGEELETIIEDKKYDEDVSNMLRLVFPIMIEYYGDEYKDISFNTLREINIEKPAKDESMYDIVERNTPANIVIRSQIGAVNKREYKIASGVHSTAPILEMVDGKIVLVGKSEVVSIRESDNTLDEIANFIHELSHAVKSNQNSMNLVQDEEGNQFLVTRSGISIVYSKVYVEDGKIVVEDIKESNIGMEEGINTFDEIAIINKILLFPRSKLPNECQKLRDSLKLPDSKTEYVSGAYVQETLCADKLLSRCGLKEIVRKDQFIGTNNCEKAYNALSERSDNNWEQLNKKVDLSVRHTYERYKHSRDMTWLSEKIPGIMQNLRDIHDMLDESIKSKNMIELNKNE